MSEEPGSTLVDLFDGAQTAGNGVDAAALPLPGAIDVWKIDAVLGGGSDAVVYAAHNVHAPRIEAAIKVPVSAGTVDAATEARFLKEARILAGLHHPNIVSVRNVRLDHRPPFIEMLCVDGPSLSARLAQGHLSGLPLLQVAADLTSAVAYLLEQGVHHRDLKPANVLLGSDGAVIVDFGLACSRHEWRVRPIEGAQGTLGYLPPEWAPDGMVDAEAWDRYALGVVLFECCTGQRAFPLDPERSRLEQLPAIQAHVRTAGPLDPGVAVPAGLRSLIGRLTAIEPAHRQVDLAAASKHLSELAQGDGSADVALDSLVADPGPARGRAGDPVPSTETDRRAGARGPIRRALLGLGAMVLLAGLGFGLRFDVDQGPSTVAGGAVSVRLALALSPADPILPVEVLLDEARMDRRRRPGPVLTVGAHTLEARLGIDCGDGPLPVWCAAVSEAVTVREGSREHVILSMQLPEVPSHPVALRSEGTPPTRLRIDDGPWTACPDLGGCELSLLPGPARSVFVQAGRCPEDPCGEECPAGCVEASDVLEVPFTPTTPLSLALALPALSAVAGPSVVFPSAAADGRILGPPITIGDFQAFVRVHPEYARGGSAALQKADDNYLRGWEGDVVRDSIRKNLLSPQVPVEWVSPAVFEDYCALRGKEGLAHVEDGSAPVAGRELRRAGDRWVALSANGETASVPNARQSLKYFIARCRR